MDDQTQEKIHLESEAVLIILSKIQSQHGELLGCDIIDFEISKIPDKERKKKVEQLTQEISETQSIPNELVQRAKMIEKKGIKPLDSLHIAAAKLIDSDYMITTDKDIIKKYQKFKKFFNKIKICSPPLFLMEGL